jgi:hypothetical protein
MLIEFFSNQFETHYDKITALSLLLITGLYFRFLLEVFGQVWVKTKAHTTTLMLLPIITYVITNVISGNIALSLGMVGALSIVRFRNPVRSPLELSVYFASITMGIAATVSIQWLYFLIGSITLAIIVIVLLNFFCNKIFKKPLFITSFSEGNYLSTLTVITTEIIEICETSDLLQSKLIDDKNIIYSFASDNFEKLKKLEMHNDIKTKCNSIELRR